MNGKSLDDIERDSFQPGETPWDLQPTEVGLRKGKVRHAPDPPGICLDGGWVLAEGGTESERVNGHWDDTCPYTVPGSVHRVLFEQGRLSDPTFGINHNRAREESFKTWWVQKKFSCQHDSGKKILRFQGVANTLVVRLEPVPFVPSQKSGSNSANNLSWRKTVVVNNVYGWHYSNLPSLGIWRSVGIDSRPSVTIDHPFIRTRSPVKGEIEVALRLTSDRQVWSGTIKVSIEPVDFRGDTYNFQEVVEADRRVARRNFLFRIPDVRLWWPVDLGDPNLYRIRLSFTSTEGGGSDFQEVIFGVRTVEMAPLPVGPEPDNYNWTFEINGRTCFVKGTGWCTMDALLNFSRDRYKRFLELASMQHVQLLRAWGSGMPETDDFYNLCDRQGIMVIQEWPTAWNSHKEQPFGILEETVKLNTLRLRNHPSLVMWGGGNESSDPFGEAIDMMGRLSLELDGTRPFHRGEPWGGSVHDYECYWGNRHLDYNLNLTADFFGEFGPASMPVLESVRRYLPKEEADTWPSKEDGAFAYHTPVFNTQEDISRLSHYAGYFAPIDASQEEYILGSQLAQTAGVRHTLERSRTRWPDCSGVLYYKLNDNFPAASWSSIYWYGVPKIGHYFFQDALSPLHACVIFSTLNLSGDQAELPVFLLDDDDVLSQSHWKVIVRAFDSRLNEIKCESYSGQGSITSPRELGKFILTSGETDSAPLLVVTEVRLDTHLADRTFYFLNFENRKGCLFTLPGTTLDLETNGKNVKIINTGNRPAVAVEVARPGHLDTFTVSDNCFWLDVGEERELQVNTSRDLMVKAWNSR